MPRNSRAVSTKTKRCGDAMNTNERCDDCSARARRCRRTFWMTSTGRKRNRNVARCARSDFSTHEDYETEEANRVADFERAQSEGDSGRGSGRALRRADKSFQPSVQTQRGTI